MEHPLHQLICFITKFSIAAKIVRLFLQLAFNPNHPIIMSSKSSILILALTLVGSTATIQAAGSDIVPGTIISGSLATAFIDTGTTVGATNNLQPNISFATQDGPDVFWSFTVVSGGTINVSAAPGLNYDLSVYALQTSDLSSYGTFVTGVDDNFAGDTETFSFNVTTGASYHIVIDSWTNSSSGSGTYTLQLSSPDGVVLAAPIPEPSTASTFAGLAAAALVAISRSRRRVG